jgi:hypothetical protein
LIKHRLKDTVFRSRSAEQDKRYARVEKPVALRCRFSLWRDHPCEQKMVRQHGLIRLVHPTSSCRPMTVSCSMFRTVKWPTASPRRGIVFFAPDWHPGDHPPMPSIVAYGRKSEVFAYGFCDRADGPGGPENASITGLPTAYIVQQMADFKSGLRGTSVHERVPPNLMISLSKAPPATAGG